MGGCRITAKDGSFHNFRHLALGIIWGIRVRKKVEAFCGLGDAGISDHRFCMG